MKPLLGVAVAIVCLLPAKASAQVVSKVGVVTIQNNVSKAAIFIPLGNPVPAGWTVVASQPGPVPIVGSYIQISAPFLLPWPYPVGGGDASLYGLARIQAGP